MTTHSQGLIGTWLFLIKGYSQRRLYWALFIGAVLLVLWVWMRSTGAANDDELGHFLIARNAWRKPFLVLDLWGRVVNTLLYMPGALVSLEAARATAVIMTALTVLTTTHIARRLGLTRLWLIPLLLWFQPGVIDQGYAALTTVPFMLLLALAVACWLDERITLSAVLMACLSLTRHEGIALFGAMWLLLLATRQWRAALLGLTPILLYNLAYLVVVQPPIQELPLMTYVFADRGTEYGSGSWEHFAVGLVILAGGPVTLLMLCALPRLRQLPRTHLVIFVPSLLYVLIHTLIFRFGLYASGGYYEFLLPVCPAVSLIAALGAEALIDVCTSVVHRSPPRTQRLVFGVWACVVALPVLFVALTVPPWQIRESQVEAQKAANWLHTTEIHVDDIWSMSVWVYHQYDLPLRTFDGWIHVPAALPLGAVLVWDSKYLEHYTAYTYAALTASEEWHLLWEAPLGTAAVFQKVK